ncbi:hypothetical protein [Singulisphaera sp. GP187]|uniref:hypothetical protein n=1 Tax=Singulisphaera sp. GP187 TaxID=1882752 RepID=UPI0020B12033|nr:hypothetical protein [Singulisphaera sp. GP187]
MSAIVDRAAAPAPTGLRATFTGRYNASPASVPGGESVLNLSGSARIPSLGLVQISGPLASNPSLPPSPTNTHGVFTLVARKAGGNVVTLVTGPTTDLTSRKPTSTQLNYTVLAAPPKLASLIGTEGVATLSLRPRGRSGPAGAPVTGQFTLRVVQS